MRQSVQRGGEREKAREWAKRRAARQNPHKGRGRERARERVKRGAPEPNLQRGGEREMKEKEAAMPNLQAMPNLWRG